MGGGAQDPLAELEDQTGLLGDADEFDRRHQPAPGMAPAHQRLDACQLVGEQGDLGLIEELELVTGQGEP